MPHIYRAEQPSSEWQKKTTHRPNKPTQTQDTLLFGEGLLSTVQRAVCSSPPACPLLTPVPHFREFPPPGVGITMQTVVRVVIFSKNTHGLQHCALNPFFPSFFGSYKSPWQDQALQPENSCPELFFHLLPSQPSECQMLAPFQTRWQQPCPAERQREKPGPWAAQGQKGF